MAAKFLKRFQRWLRQRPGIYRTLRQLWSPPERIHRHLYFEGEITVEVEPAVSFELVAYGTQIENSLFWRGFAGGWERSSLIAWRELVREAGFIADIGSNTGIYALSAQALRPQAKVIALEPSARVFERLQRNIALNGYPIIALECAASDRSGTATFHDYPGEHQYSASLEDWGGSSITTQVPVARLDDVLEREGFPRLDAIKIDVERHEPAVLRGMRRTLELYRPSALVEILDEEMLREVEDCVSGLGYEFRKLADFGLYTDWNYLLALPDRLSELERRLPADLFA